MNCGYVVFLVFRAKGQEITLTHALGANLAQQWSKPVLDVLLDYGTINHIIINCLIMICCLACKIMLFIGLFLLQMKPVAY